MEIFIGNQLKNIGYSIILGLIFGAFYDIICIIHIIVGVVSDSGDRAVRRDPAARVIFLLTDLCFMLGVTLMMSLFLYEFASGDFRVYLLAGAAAGFTVYRLTLGPMGWILRLVGRFAAWIWAKTAGALMDILRERFRTAELHRAEKRLAREIRIE